VFEDPLDADIIRLDFPVPNVHEWRAFENKKLHTSARYENNSKPPKGGSHPGSELFAMMNRPTINYQ
jgi:hypothetical protein